MNQNGGKITWILEAEDGNYNSTMARAEATAAATATGVDRQFRSLADSTRKSLHDTAVHAETAGRKISLYLGAPIALAMKEAVQSAGTFESSMSQLRVASGATASQMEVLQARARELGKDNNLAGVTAQQAASAMTELSKAGLDVNDTLGASRGVLQLAKAGQLEFSDAAIITASALNAFRLKGEQAGYVADVLANGANKSQASLHDLGLGLQQASSIASLFGIDIEETVTALSIFANNGIRASDAGTSLKTMLLSIATPSKKAAELMSEIGFNAYDAQGNFVGLKEMSDRLKNSLEGMTEQQKQTTLGTIFGSDATRAAALLAQNAGKNYDEMANAIGRQGSAQALASAQMGPFQKSLEALKNEFSEAGLQIGALLLPRLTELFKSIEKGLQWFNGLSDEQQMVITKVLLFTAALGPALLAYGALLRTISVGIGAYTNARKAIDAVTLAVNGFKLANAGIEGASQGNVFFKIGEAAAKVGPMISSAVGAIGKIGPAIAKVGPIVGTVISTMVNVISIGARAIGAAIFSIPVVGWILLAITALVGLFTYFYNTSEEFRNFVNGVFSGIGDVIVNAFNGTKEGVTNVFNGIRDTIGNIVNGIVGFFTPIVATIAGVFNAIGTTIATVVGSIISFLTPLFQIIGLIGYAIYGFGQIVFTIFSAIGQIVFTIVSTIVQIIGVILYGTFLRVFQGIQLLVQFVLTAIGAYFNFVGQVISTVVNTIATVITTVFNAIVAFLTPIVQTIVDFFTVQFNIMKTIVTTVFNAISSVVTTVFNAISAFLTPIITNIVNFVVQRFNNLVANVQRVFGLIKQYIINPVADVVNFVGAKIGQIATFIGNAVRDAYNKVADFVGRFTSAGKNIIDGIVNGIKNSAGNVVNVVKDICANALDSVKKFFGIKSPSRVMAKMGQYLMQGFGIGIDKNAREAVSSATTAASSVLGAFDGMSAKELSVSANYDATASRSYSPYGQDYSAAGAYTSARGPIEINQYNTINTELDMNQVNRNITWELNKL